MTSKTLFKHTKQDQPEKHQTAEGRGAEDGVCAERGVGDRHEVSAPSVQQLQLAGLQQAPGHLVPGPGRHPATTQPGAPALHHPHLRAAQGGLLHLATLH